MKFKNEQCQQDYTPFVGHHVSFKNLPHSELTLYALIAWSILNVPVLR